jgi:hypothetical protein
MTGMAMGCILLIIGLVPGLLDKWAEELTNIAETFLFRLNRAPLASRTRPEFGEQRWLAALGMALIALSLYLFTAR